MKNAYYIDNKTMLIQAKVLVDFNKIISLADSTKYLVKLGQYSAHSINITSVTAAETTLKNEFRDEWISEFMKKDAF